MTVLAVVGLFAALALLPAMEEKESLLRRALDAEQWASEAEGQVAELERKLDAAHAAQTAREEVWERERAGMKAQLQEAARNEEMFDAIQRAQEIVDRISAESGLAFSADQTLQFGDDLVEFELNSVEPEWKGEGRERLRRFCELLVQRLGRRTENGVPLRDLFTVQIEGHTDSTPCLDDPNCNWRISSGRAASFVALMRNDEFCPGGEVLPLRPVGLADSRPLDSSDSEPRPVRRIAVRVLPDYHDIIRAEG